MEKVFYGMACQAFIVCLFLLAGLEVSPASQGVACTIFLVVAFFWRRWKGSKNGDEHAT